MPFHLFHPPHLHFLPIVLSSALAFAAGAYLVSRQGVPARFARLTGKLKDSVTRRNDRANCQQNFAQTGRKGASSFTGNSAFEDYRAAQLSGLEAEAAEFRAYLDSLRNATDKKEFEAFLNERLPNAAAPEQPS
jgi:Protein of unknown function (DUF2852)